MDELSVAEAAGLLRVDDSRVRQMLRSGMMRGRHVGRVWVVPADEVARLRVQRPGSGRPLAAQRAWAVLDLLDGGRAPWIDKVVRSQVRAQIRRLSGREVNGWRDALRAREYKLSIAAHRAAVGRLNTTAGVWLTGAAAASVSGADLVALAAVPEFYVHPERWPALVTELHLVDTVGRADVVIRLPREVWPFGPQGPGRAALAASLLDNAEWRTAHSGATILNELAQELLG